MLNVVRVPDTNALLDADARMMKFTDDLVRRHFVLKQVRTVAAAPSVVMMLMCRVAFDMVCICVVM